MPSYRIPSAYDRPPLRRRASGLALALGINALLLLVLLGLGVKPPPGLRQSQPPLVIDLVRESARAESRPEPAPQPLSRQSAARPAVKPPPIVLPVKPTITPPPRLDMLEMTPQEYAAADIAKLPKAGAGASGANDSEEVGRGPNGEILYAAEWARRPSHAELGNYLPDNAPEGYGLIACRTLPGNRVDDCIELENYPRGSGLARAVRHAAWQFRVRPPRKNGQTLVGSWVRIRIDYSHSGP